jgi:hypothetical protein
MSESIGTEIPREAKNVKTAAMNTDASSHVNNS